MSKKMKIIILAIGLLIIIPIATFAAIKITKVPVMNKEEIAEANLKENERALAEKAKFAEEHKNKAGTSIEGLNIDEINSTEKSKLIIQDNDSELEEEQLRKIIERYYSKEYLDRIVSDIESNYSGMVDWTTTKLTKPEKELYELIINIIENEELSEKDKDVLKGFLEENLDSIKKDENLKTKTENILK